MTAIKKPCLCMAVMLLIVNSGMCEDNSLSDSTHGLNETYLHKVFGSRVDPLGRDNIVRNKAAFFISESGYMSISQVCDIYKNLTRTWTYIKGPETGNYDYLNNASALLSVQYKGDCNEFAILMASMVKSISGATRIVFGRSPEKSHAWAEVYIGNRKNDEKSVTRITNYLEKKYNITKINLDLNVTSGDAWLNLDWGEDFSKPAPCPGGSPRFNAVDTYPVYSDKAVKGLQTSPLSRFTIYPCEMVNASLNVTFDAQNIRDVDSIAAYTWDFGDGTDAKSKDPKINHTYLRAGNYSVLLIVTDEDNISDSSKATFCARGFGNPSGPAIESFSADPDNITSGASSILSWTTLDASSVTLSPGFGSVSSNGTQQISPGATTTYTLNASSSKSFDKRSITILVKQRPKQPAQPAGVFSCSPVRPKVGEMISFDSSKSSGEGSNINYYEWNFGDGNYNTSKVCLHSYNKAGNYTVVLAVTDDNGQKNFTLKQISVLPRDLAVDSFKFTPNPVCSGQPTIMTWSTTGATNVVVTPKVGNLPASGSAPIYSDQSMGYTIQAFNDTAQTRPKTVFLEVRQCGLDVPGSAAESNLGTTPGTLVVKGTAKYVGGNVVRIGLTVKLQEIFNGLIYDIGRVVSSRADGTYEIVYSSESLRNPNNPDLVLQAFFGDKPLTGQVPVENKRRVDLICSSH